MPGSVYIIGAGASYADTLHLDTPMPLATDFFKKKLLDEHWSSVLGFPDLKEAALTKILKHYFSFDIVAQVGRDAHVEEVYSFIANTLDIFPSRADYSREIFYLAKRQLEQYIRSVVVYAPWKVDRPHLYSHIAETIAPQDTVITFNWDFLLDRCLERTEPGRLITNNARAMASPVGYVEQPAMTPWEFRYERRHAGYYLKLHGSVNWTVCSDPRCPHYEVPFIFEASDSEDCAFWPCLSCGGPTEVFLVPPHVHKSYLPRRFLRQQAQLAASKLSIAEEIVAIGYSFPPFDFQANMMIRLARQGPEDEGDSWLQKVTIVNPSVNDSAWLSSVTQLFGIEGAARAYGHPVELELHKSVNDYLSSLKPARYPKRARRKSKAPNQ